MNKGKANCAWFQVDIIEGSSQKVNKKVAKTEGNCKNVLLKVNKANSMDWQSLVGKNATHQHQWLYLPRHPQVTQ